MKTYINYKKRFALLSAVAVILAIFAWSSFPDTTNDVLEIAFVDVGQGDSIFIKTPEGKTLLIDGGADDMFDTHLRPFLLSQKALSVDFALATHYHSDHAGGISKLLKSGSIDTLIVPDYTPASKTKDRLLSLAENSNTNVLQVSEGSRIPFGNPKINLLVLHPPAGGFSDSENSNSIVLKLEYAKTVLLFTGDLEADGEEILLEKYDLESDILKVGHHGSSTSSSAEFLKAVDPTYAVIQCGAGNSYGHPHYEVKDALENDDVRIYRTDKDGHIIFRISENGIESIKTSR